MRERGIRKPKESGDVSAFTRSTTFHAATSLIDSVIARAKLKSSPRAATLRHFLASRNEASPGRRQIPSQGRGCCRSNLSSSASPPLSQLRPSTHLETRSHDSKATSDDELWNPRGLSRFEFMWAHTRLRQARFLNDPQRRGTGLQIASRFS